VVVRKKRPGLAALVGAVGAIVFLECFLREAIEGEGGDGAVEMWSGDAPRAVGAAPAGEVITFDPDQTFIHTSTFCVRFGIRARARRVEHITASSAEGELLPAERVLSTDSQLRKVTKVFPR
jgi:hypothetical protein